MNDYKGDAWLIVLMIVMMIVFIFVAKEEAFACNADVGTATTECYVRSIDDGSIKGSLAKGDQVIVTGNKKGWTIISVNEKKFKVWGDYLDVHDQCLDEVQVLEKIRKSKSAGKTVFGKKKCRIEGSAFDGLSFW